MSALSLRWWPATPLARPSGCDEPGDLCRDSHRLPIPVCSQVGLEKGALGGEKAELDGPTGRAQASAQRKLAFSVGAGGAEG